ncbi:MAG: hypothetical protein AAB365_01585 [Patescibacteria group bacterium]
MNMHIVVYVFAGIFLFGLAACGVTMLCMWIVARNQLEEYKLHWKNIQTVSVHTYKPRNSVVPYRGWLVLTKGYNVAASHNIPLILSVGNTVPGELRTEAEMYRDALVNRFGPNHGVQVIVARNRSVRETFGEVKETQKEIWRLGSSKHAVIGLAPHIARICLLWRRATKAIPEPKRADILFVPVSKGPLRYWFWEAAMLWMHFIAPPESRLQNWLLDLVGRKG